MCGWSMKNIGYYSSGKYLYEIIEENGYIVKIGVVDSIRDGVSSSLVIDECIKELDEYFNKKRTVFNVPIKQFGTEFQMKVFEVLKSIPYGHTLSYKDVAILIGKPKASRAVGNACNKNPIMIVVPCHRVIGKNGKLVGFAYGTDLKEKLLELER